MRTLNERGARIMKRLKTLRERADVLPIGDICGGGMIALDLVQERGQLTPAPKKRNHTHNHSA